MARCTEHLNGGPLQCVRTDEPGHTHVYESPWLADRHDREPGKP